MPASLVPIKSCQLYGMTWRFKNGKWKPVCAHCQHDMAMMDIQRAGIRIATGGAQTGSFAQCSNPARGNQRSLPLGGAATLRAVEANYQAKSRG
jgi:hypothetical protein